MREQSPPGGPSPPQRPTSTRNLAYTCWKSLPDHRQWRMGQVLDGGGSHQRKAGTRMFFLMRVGLLRGKPEPRGREFWRLFGELLLPMSKLGVYLQLPSMKSASKYNASYSFRRSFNRVNSWSRDVANSQIICLPSIIKCQKVSIRML